MTLRGMRRCRTNKGDRSTFVDRFLVQQKVPVKYG